MKTLKFEEIYNEYVKSQNSEIICNYCSQIENNKLKNELEKFISHALTELNKNKFIFSLYILQAYEFDFKRNEKHLEYITEGIISFLNDVKKNEYKIEDDVSYIISEFFDIMNKLEIKYDEIIIYPFKELPDIVYELSKIKFKRGSHMETAILKTMNLLNYKLSDFESSIKVLEHIEKNHFDESIKQEASDLLFEIRRNYK